MPYDDYLAIWKTKGKVPLNVASTATQPAMKINSAQVVGKADEGQATVVSEQAVKSAQQMEKDLDALHNEFVTGATSEDALYDGIDFLGENFDTYYPGLDKKVFDKAVADLMQKIANKPAVAKKALKSTASAPKPVASPVPASGSTSTVALDYDTAQAVYKMMKKQMPGGTPAQWRHAAAKHLGVDYNDYLKAWKNKPPKVTGSTPPSAAPPSAPAPPSSPQTVIPVSPSTTGKYAQSDISLDDLKDELARLYGPNANKSYINPTWDEVTGSYKVQFPSSLLNSAGKEAVAEGLKKLGLKVERKGADYIITPGKPRIPKPGEFTKIDSDGNTVINMTEAQKRTDRWWDTLDSETKDAWNFYTGSGYSEMNRQLRGLADLSPANRRRAKRLTDSMEDVEDEFTVVRGGSYDLDDFKGKRKWTSDGFTSTAANGGFGGNCRFIITVTKGTRGKWIGKKSRHPGEKEFLLDKGMDFRITKIDDSKSPPVVHLTTIPKKKA